MEVINVHKRADIKQIFSPFHYQKALSELYPGVNLIVLHYITEKIGRAHAKLKEFDPNTDDNTLIRNIIKQEDVYAEFSTDFNKNSNPIQSDVIILGKKHNWSRFTDVLITKFNNYKYNYPRDVLDDHKKLIAAQYLAYQIRECVIRFKPEPDLPGFIQMTPISVFYESNIVIDPAKLAGVADFCYNMYRVRLDVTNFGSLYIQLRSLGLLEVIYKTPKQITEVVRTRIQNEILNFGRIKTEKENLNAMSAYNLLQKILVREYDSNSEVFNKFRSLAVTSVDQFYKNIPKKDEAKIKKIIGDRLADVYETPCTHTDMVKQFINGRKYLREKVIEMCDIDKNTMQYHCNKCSRRAFCQHHLDTGMKKTDFINKYKSPELSNRIIYYCKYCSEKIYKNETEYILNGADLVALSKAKENSLARETNIDMFDNGLYNGITSAIQCFKIDYEFSNQVLIRTIRSAIYGVVHDQITSLNIENDSQYELITKLYSFIFTLVYLRPLFMKDPKVNTKSKTPKKDSAYGQFINQESGARFKELANAREVLNIIKIAIVRFRDNKISDVRLQVKTEKDDILEIVQTKKFGLLCQYYNYGNPETSPLDVFRRLVKKSKPNISNFDEGMIVPSKNVNETDKNIFTHLFDYTSPYCYIHRLADNETLGELEAVAPKYDPKIYNDLTQKYEKDARDYWIKSYRDVVGSVKDFPFGVAYGPNFMYDDEGNIIDWKPMGWGKDWEYTSPGGKQYHLSKIKASIDRTTDAKIKARNEVLGFSEAEFVTRSEKKEKEKQEVEQTKEKYEFNKKLIGSITSLDSKFNHYMVEYLGRTETYEYHNLVKGLIPNVTSYVAGSYRINAYIRILLERYYTLKNNPLSPANASFFETSNIDFLKTQEEIRGLPNEPFRAYFDQYKKNISSWDPKDFYYWNLEKLLGFCDSIIKSGHIGKAFCVNYVTAIFAEDKKRSVPDERKIIMNIVENKLDEGEYDETQDYVKKTSALHKIDYEEDEDDINDFS